MEGAQRKAGYLFGFVIFLALRSGSLFGRFGTVAFAYLGIGFAY